MPRALVIVLAALLGAGPTRSWSLYSRITLSADHGAPRTHANMGGDGSERGALPKPPLIASRPLSATRSVNVEHTQATPSSKMVNPTPTEPETAPETVQSAGQNQDASPGGASLAPRVRSFVQHTACSSSDLMHDYKEMGIDALMARHYDVHLLTYYIEVQKNLTSTLGRKPTVDEWAYSLNVAVSSATLTLCACVRVWLCVCVMPRSSPNPLPLVAHIFTPR